MSPPRALLVEDSPLNLELVTMVLERAGFEVDGAADGHEACAKAFANAYGVIVLDLTLPDLDGLEVARRLRAHPATSTCPIVAVTGQIELADEQQAYAVGCDGFITKPIDAHSFGQEILRFVRPRA
jgi:two-component system, cell cycle response regulator DivK